MKISRLTAIVLAGGVLVLVAPRPAAAQATPTPTCISGTPSSTPPALPPIAPPYARPKGLRVTVTGINPSARQVSFDVTLNTTAGFATGNRSYPFGAHTDTWKTLYGATTGGAVPGWFQPYCSSQALPVQTYAGGGFIGPVVVDPSWPSIQDGLFGLWFNYYLASNVTTWVNAYGAIPWPAYIANPQIAPVDYGDGNVATGVPILPLVNPGTPQYGTFRGSFTHTYPPAPDTFTIKAAAASLFLGANSPGNPYVAGLTAGRPGVVVGYAGTYQVERYGWSGTGTTTWNSATFTYRVASPAGRILAITNTALVDFAAAAAPIPTSSAAGLFALALLLAGLGIILMRR